MRSKWTGSRERMNSLSPNGRNIRPLIASGHSFSITAAIRS
uniref:Uncharacterized protein n=1 Tax=Ascaris lumbricoides TaxID=6252 RepID=A0A0M3HJE0_ASCLU